MCPYVHIMCTYEIYRGTLKRARDVRKKSQHDFFLKILRSLRHSILESVPINETVAHRPCPLNIIRYPQESTLGMMMVLTNGIPAKKGNILKA